MKLRIKGARLVTQDAQRRILEADVWVGDDGRIAHIGEHTDRAEETIDGRGKLLLPGLVNAHTHLAMTLLRGYGDDLTLEDWLRNRIWPMEDRMTEADIRAGTRLAALEMIASGTTSFLDMYFHEDAVADECANAGLRGYAGWGMVDLGKTQGDGDPNPRLGEAENFLKKWKDHPRIHGAIGPHAVYTCGTATYQKSVELAERYDTLLTTHAHETRTEVYDVLKLKGARPLAWLEQRGALSRRTVLGHAGWVTKAEAQKLGTTGASVAHCPVSNLKLATGVAAPIPEYVAAKVPVSLGTDGAASNNTLDMFETMKFAALVQKQARWDATIIPAQQALDFATLGGARALNLEKEIGSIQVGRKADLILVDLAKPRMTPMHDPISQLVYACHGDDVHATIVDGIVLKLGSEFRTLDPARVMDDAEKAAKRLAPVPPGHAPSPQA